MAYVINSDVCLCCGACAPECPVNAIVDCGSFYEVDPEACIDCGSCAAVCPAGAFGP